MLGESCFRTCDMATAGLVTPAFLISRRWLGVPLFPRSATVRRTERVDPINACCFNGEHFFILALPKQRFPSLWSSSSYLVNSRPGQEWSRAIAVLCGGAELAFATATWRSLWNVNFKIRRRIAAHEVVPLYPKLETVTPIGDAMSNRLFGITQAEFLSLWMQQLVLVPDGSVPESWPCCVAELRLLSQRPHEADTRSAPTTWTHTALGA